MDIFLYTGATSVTGRILAKAIGYSGKQTYNSETRPTNVIRWGSSVGISKRASQVTLNQRNAIVLATDKLRTLEHFARVGVPHPAFMRLNREIPNVPGFCPALARNLNHTQGRDIVFCLQHVDLLKAITLGKDFAVKYVPTQVEYRFHVFKDEIIKISEKVLVDDTKFVPWIRNFEHGYAFRNPRNRPSRMTQQAAISAVEALGLDFGAVDVVVDDQGRPFVLEINTGPGLVRSTAERYITKFQEACNIPAGQINLEVLNELNNDNEE